MQIADDSKELAAPSREKLELYRSQLLSFGMLEPTKWQSSTWHWYFYKQATPLTAFVVNLGGYDDHAEVTYGYASTAFTRMTGSENSVIEQGLWDDDISIRERILIYDESDEAAAKESIRKMYHAYWDVPKDELLSLAKAKRKEFIQQIAVKLKPMGFKKKGNFWKRALESEYYLMFNAQKSLYADKYYFNIYIGKNGTDFYGDCYYTRPVLNETALIDWQALPREEFEKFLDQTVVPALTEIINTPLQELGKNPSYWIYCTCKRDQCEQCWMQKSRWELQQA